MIEYNILQNGLDSLKRTLRYLSENDGPGTKAAVKEVISAVELLLKEILRRSECRPRKPYSNISKV